VLITSLSVEYLDLFPEGEHSRLSVFYSFKQLLSEYSISSDFCLFADICFSKCYLLCGFLIIDYYASAPVGRRH